MILYNYRLFDKLFVGGLFLPFGLRLIDTECEILSDRKGLL